MISMNNSMYYHIGGLVVEILGEKAQDILQLNAFTFFETNKSEATIAIQLEKEYDDFKEDFLIYSLAYDDIRFNCFKISDSSYGFKIVDTANNKKLSVSYERNTSFAVIGGDGNPTILLFALWLAYGVVAIQHRLIAIHSSVIMYKGKAVLFLGESGTGKSTHTRLWRENFKDAVLLNDDSPILQVNGDKIYVHGSPWSGKTPCFRREVVELAGIVRLSQAPYNRIKPLKVLEAFAALYPSCPPAFANDPVLSDLVCSMISDTLKSVKVWHLECLPDADAAKLSFKTIFNDRDT